MAANKDKIVPAKAEQDSSASKTVRISNDFYEQLLDAQTFVRKATKSKPSLSDLLFEAWEANSSRISARLGSVFPPPRGTVTEKAEDNSAAPHAGATLPDLGVDITPHERVLLDGLLRLIRSDDAIAEVVLAGVGRWMKDNPPREAERKGRKAS